MPYANEERIVVASYKEIILIFLTFCVILFVLYPKNLLTPQALQQDSNYDLSMFYLKNMLRQDPNNETLMLMLAQKSLQADHKEITQSLLEKLLTSSNISIKKEAFFLRYKLFKQYYLTARTEPKKTILREKLISTFLEIFQHKYYSKEMYQTMYQEAMFLELPHEAYYFLTYLIKNNSHSVSLLTQTYYMADSLQKDADALKYLHILEVEDRSNVDKWFSIEYYQYIKTHQFNKAEVLLKTLATHSTKWREELAHYYVSMQKYQDASNIYMQLFSSQKAKKKQYFLDALHVLQSGNLMKQAADLGFKYQDMFIDDISIRIFLLKLYLEANEPKKAAALSHKLLQKKVH